MDSGSTADFAIPSVMYMDPVLVASKELPSSATAHFSMPCHMMQRRSSDRDADELRFSTAGGGIAEPSPKNQQQQRVTGLTPQHREEIRVPLPSHGVADLPSEVTDHPGSSGTQNCKETDEGEDLEECGVLNNGCGEAVSPPSSCADYGLGFAGHSLAARAYPMSTELPDDDAVQGARFFTAQPVLRSSFAAQHVNGISTAPHGAAAARPSTKDCRRSTGPQPGHSSFAAKAVDAIARRAGGGTVVTKVPSAFSLPSSVMMPAHQPSQTLGVVTDSLPSSSLIEDGDLRDPIGIRRLYSFASAHPGGGVAEGTGPSTHNGGFTVAHFAVFFEVALNELMEECERRIANAPVSLRDGQQRALQGLCNHNLDISTHSFDSAVAAAPPPLLQAPTSQVVGRRPSTASSLSSAAFPHSASKMNGGPTAGRAEPVASNPHVSPTMAAQQQQPPSSSSPPSPAQRVASVKDLLCSLEKHHGEMAAMVFIAALAYLARLTVHCASEFFSITTANWYRMTLAAILVAAKVYDEHSSRKLNAHFARSSGIPLPELNRMELNFLYLIDFELLLKEAEVEQWLGWMETLATRHQLMTPLQSFVLGPNRGATWQPTTSALPSPVPSYVSLNCTDGGKDAAGMENSCGAQGLSSALAEGGPSSPSVTLPQSFCHSRTTPHQRISSNTFFCAIASRAGGPQPLVSPVTELMTPVLRSPASSVFLHQSFITGPGGGGGAASLLGRRPAVPPSPVCGVMPVTFHAVEKRLFTMVHGAPEPPSPVSVRHLSLLGRSPPTTLRPPSLERCSPVAFFRQRHPHASSGHGVPSASRGPMKALSLPRESVDTSAMVASPPVSTGADVAEDHWGRRAEQRSRDRLSESRLAPPENKATSSSSTRWGPFGMVKHVRDVLGVTASLVRGQLNVLATSPTLRHHDEASRRRGSSLERGRDFSGQSGNRLHHTRQGLSFEPLENPYSIGGRGGDGGAASDASMHQPTLATYQTSAALSVPDDPSYPSAYGVPSSLCATVAPPPEKHPFPPHCSYTGDVEESCVEAEDDLYEEEEDEEAYGYYGDDGYFYYYEDEDDYGDYYDEEEGDGDEQYYDDEVEEEADYFQRCRPPLTHSPL